MSRWYRMPQNPSRPSNPGSKVRPIMQAKTDDDGNRRLVQIGEQNAYDLIQSYRDDTLLENVIKRCTLSGDYSALKQRVPQYLDTLSMPQDLMQAYQVTEAAKNLYNTLTPEQKQQYDGFEGFLSSFQTAEGIRSFFESKPTDEISPSEGIMKNGGASHAT